MSTALITGAAGAMGQAIRDRLLADDWIVALTDLDLPALEATLTTLDSEQRSRVSTHRLNVRDAEQCRAVVDAVVELHGGLDALINNAGIMVRHDALHTTDDEWTSILDVNAGGAFRMATAAHSALAAAASGAIVSVSSTHATLAARNSIAYSTSKAALSHLTRLLALEWSGDGIRVNAVAPTVVPSAMTEDVLADPAYIARKMAAIPLGKPIPAAHVAGAIAYLLSADAGSTTGQILVLDGGESLA